MLLLLLLALPAGLKKLELELHALFPPLFPPPRWWPSRR